MRVYLLVFCAASIGSAVAATLRVPTNEPVAMVQIADNWPVSEQGEFVEADSPDNLCHPMLLPPEGRKVGESIGEGIRYIRRTDAITVRQGAPKKETIPFKGRDMSVMSWEASQNNQPIMIRCYVVPISRADSFLVIAWGSADEQKKHATAIGKVINSLRPVVGLPHAE